MIKALAVLLAAFALSGAAAQDRRHLEEYKAYLAAQQAGDAAATTRYAEAAWRAAETELGGHETTALLAQNYLWEVLLRDPEEAEEAAARALALGEQGLGLGNFTLTELRLADAFAKNVHHLRRRSNREALLAAIETYPPQEALTSVLVSVYDQSIVRAYVADEYGLAYDAATLFERRLAEEPGVSDSRQASILTNRAAALIASRRSRFDSKYYSRTDAKSSAGYEERLADAQILLDAAAALFPKTKRLDEMDPNQHLTRAWNGVAVAIGRSMDYEVPEDWAFEGHRGRFSWDSLMTREGADGAEILCEVSWTKRDMHYPAAAMRDGYIGAVLVGYHLDTDGHVIEPRVLAEIPQEIFSQTILKEMKDWEADAGNLDPACLRDHLTSFNFTMQR
ncbi:energy transducer TonB [Parvularcula dongshanensis]|uniref:TonB C-terminal domain-containing protein n=1 Tax=Parvularcula dongshanensis TaxID=1173995 RepID=A0A840I2C6_9PROT|nr:energy transducer TonB [Parvularcula dongshanensis]MBB4658887.1 hypothetical protein [Parvularcula dongshanensis]